MNHKFPIIYWSKKSTKVQFEAFTEMPENAEVTACMVFVKKDNSVLLSRPKRGWGLPGGHKNTNETPENCAVREVLEETNVRIKNLSLVGGWKAQKISHTDANDKYPQIAYQLLFTADVNRVNKFTPKFESFERKFVKYDEIKKYHHEYNRFSKILAYILFLSENSND